MALAEYVNLRKAELEHDAAMLNLSELERANRAKEAETKRSNLANERLKEAELRWEQSKFPYELQSKLDVARINQMATEYSANKNYAGTVYSVEGANARQALVNEYNRHIALLNANTNLLGLNNAYSIAKIQAQSAQNVAQINYASAQNVAKINQQMNWNVASLNAGNQINLQNLKFDQSKALDEINYGYNLEMQGRTFEHDKLITYVNLENARRTAAINAVGNVGGAAINAFGRLGQGVVMSNNPWASQVIDIDYDASLAQRAQREAASRG